VAQICGAGFGVNLMAGMKVVKVKQIVRQR